MLQQAVGPHDEVVFRRAVDGRARDFEVILLFVVLERDHFECIFQMDGIEDGLQVVIAVGPSFGDAQSEVYLCVGKCYHDML